MKIIFLDIDSVLSFGNGLEIPLVNNLKLLLDDDVEIVLSSDWRLKEVCGKKLDNLSKLELIFKQHGIKHWIDETPDFDNKHNSKNLEEIRCKEIVFWLNENKQKLDITNWVIIDDMDLEISDSPDIKDHFVLCIGGFSETALIKAQKILNRSF